MSFEAFGWADCDPITLYEVDPSSDRVLSTSTYKTTSVMYKLFATQHVAVAVFNTPETLNSLSLNLVWEMFCVLEHAKRDPAVHALLFTGAGRAFCSGFDFNVSTKTGIPPETQQNYLSRGLGQTASDLAMKNATVAFWRFPKPCLVAVNGAAVGGGANIALANYFDHVLCGESARFKYPFAQLGISPELGSSFTLPRAVGPVRAKAILMLGEWFSAQEAVAMGLANRVVPDGSLFQEAFTIAAKWAAVPNQRALVKSKQLLNHHFMVPSTIEQIGDEENRVIRECVGQDGAAALVNAAKRGKPSAKPHAKL